MSSLNDPDLTPARHTPSQRRRRLIKLGAGSVPVALTLASRPVFAASQCNTTSAWGSAILMNGGASVRARATSTQLTASGWTMRAITGNLAQTGVGGGIPPWQVIYNQRYNGTQHDGLTDSQYAQMHLLVSDVFPGGLSGYAGTPTTVYDVLLANSNTKDFVPCLLAARINALYGSASISQCLSNQKGEDLLAQMATGQFLPSNGGSTSWNKDDIILYLLKNSIVTR